MIRPAVCLWVECKLYKCFWIKSGGVHSHSSIAAWESQRSALADWDHTRTTVAYWPSSVSMGTKKPFLPLLRLESYLLLFYLGEAHRDYLQAQCCCSGCYYLQRHYRYLISLPRKVPPNFQCSSECQFDKMHLALGFITFHLISSVVIFLFVMHICTVALYTCVRFSNPDESFKLKLCITPVFPPSVWFVFCAGLHSPAAPILQPRLSSQHANSAVCRFSWIQFRWQFFASAFRPVLQTLTRAVIPAFLKNKVNQSDLHIFPRLLRVVVVCAVFSIQTWLLPF